ncbi:peptidase S10 [Rhodothalassium salexigens]|uniref:S10 family peptidase n=1 Tax=Rhodothalassium salexigens TaxID=1086 RepID=UPI0019142291|nr:hypothetical protein [Rhodothalassium salexigens]MBK5911504.1 peptidase S10 [Rhodothalassium salexigens]
MFSVRLACGALAMALAIGSPAAAQDPSASHTKNEAGAKAEAHAPRSFTTEHEGTFNGSRVRYRAVAGETLLRGDDGEPTAAMFSVAYLKKGVDDPTERPVTFLFNGGPGSASLWLHMGAFGPKRVAIPSDARDDGPPPYPIVDNPRAILDVTDIVFIDPVGTGYSHALGDHEDKDFWGVHQDARSVAQFIRQWLTANGRWNSPKFLGGESYGTLRTAAVTRELEGGYNDVALNGLILISSVLDMAHDATGPGNDLAFAMLLPTMAATAWYHDQVADKPKTVAAFVEEARVFAREEYVPALLKGMDLGDAERAAVRAKLARFTGLSEAYLDQSNLRVTLWRFMKELLRDQNKVVGRLDSRYTGTERIAAGSSPEVDPSFVGIDGAYTAAINHYMRAALDVEMDREYSVISGLGGRWDWTIDGGGRFNFNVAPYIGQAMRQNSGLRVFNAAGYYDFATPVFSAEHSLSRNGVAPERITFKYYEAGHMMYIHEPSLKALLSDVRAFIKAR